MKTVSKDGFEAKSFWNSNLSDLKFNSIESHKLRVNAGKPKCDPVWETYIKKKKLQCKICIKQANRELEKGKGDVREGLKNNIYSKSFWKEWRKITKKHTESTPEIKETLNGKKLCECFAEYFSNKFSDSTLNAKLTNECLEL